MKRKLLILSVMVWAVAVTADAQGIFNENMFNHYAVGITGGTTGYGVDVATTVGDLFQLRAGVTTIPEVKMSTSLSVSSEGDVENTPNIPEDVDVEGKLNMTNFKLLVDVFPFKKSNFHFTVGTYIGPDKFVQVNNKEDGVLMPVTIYNQTASQNSKYGLGLGDYLLKPDEKGNVEGDIKVSGFKPYFGIGFGRAVPRKNRVGFMFELGCQFWGTPKIYCNGEHLTSEDIGSDDGGTIKTLSKIIAYPVISFRLCGRIL
jgi:hypothetical protein